MNVSRRPNDGDKYRNLKAELYWGLRLRFQEGDVAGLTDDKALSQLAGILYRHDARGRIEIESQEEARKRRRQEPRPCRGPHAGLRKAKALTSGELGRVEKCLAGTRTELRDCALFYLQYATGMRAGELSALDVGDVLHREMIRKEFRLGTDDTKYCRARTIYLEAPKAIAALLAYLRSRRADLAFAGDEPLFTGQKYNAGLKSFRLSPNSLAHLFGRLYERAGVIGASSHSGRRWFMTELARAGVHPRINQKRAGHSSLATTQRYIEVTPDQERRAVRSIRL